ncbi:MAG: hypothetical protein HA496_09345 [Thaumarchaeota archaeon]|jgi:hypothetical protein|nr:hypothetical protein [Nitrososphaerota archaeon]
MLNDLKTGGVLISKMSRHWKTCFVSSFYSGNMDEDRKFEEIKKGG